MVELEVTGDKLVLHVKGLDKLFAFKSRLEIPLSHVAGARRDTTIARGWWKGIRAPGTHVPGVIIAGTFYQEDKKIFWDVHDPERTIVIDLRDERYDKLIVEVREPEAAVRLIEQAIS
jgi:hypothetical protein